MALNNIWREPRREITETALGLAVVGIPGYFYARHIIYLTNTGQLGEVHTLGDWWFTVLMGGVIGLIILAIAIAAVWGAVLFIHFVGEGICDMLKYDIGFDIRPRRR